MEAILRAIAQKELRVRDDLDKLLYDDVSNIEEKEKELAALREEYWILERAWWNWRGKVR